MTLTRWVVVLQTSTCRLPWEEIIQLAHWLSKLWTNFSQSIGKRNLLSKAIHRQINTRANRLRSTTSKTIMQSSSRTHTKPPQLPWPTKTPTVFTQSSTRQIAKPLVHLRAKRWPQRGASTRLTLESHPLSSPKTEQRLEEQGWTI